jgi:hypothetical protein
LDEEQRRTRARRAATASRVNEHWRRADGALRSRRVLVGMESGTRRLLQLVRSG